MKHYPKDIKELFNQYAINVQEKRKTAQELIDEVD